MKFPFFIVFYLVLFLSFAHAGTVYQESANKLPLLPPGLTLTQPYSSGPAPVYHGRATGKKILELLVPDGWKVGVEAGISGTTTYFDANPEESWMASLERWIIKNGYRGLVRPETRDVFIRKSTSGGYQFEKKVPWKENSGSLLSWTIEGGKPLKRQLENWARTAGYTLFWETHLDFTMKGTAVFEGTFEAAIQQLFDILYYNGEMSLKATLYRGNKVIRVRQD